MEASDRERVDLSIFWLGFYREIRPNFMKESVWLSSWAYFLKATLKESFGFSNHALLQITQPFSTLIRNNNHWAQGMFQLIYKLINFLLKGKSKPFFFQSCLIFWQDSPEISLKHNNHIHLHITWLIRRTKNNKFICRVQWELCL